MGEPLLLHTLPHPFRRTQTQLMLQLPSIVTSRILNLENSLRRISFHSFWFSEKARVTSNKTARWLFRGQTEMEKTPAGVQVSHIRTGVMEASCPLYPVAGEQRCSLLCLSSHVHCLLASLETFTASASPPPLPRASASSKGHLFFSSSRSVIGFAQAGAGLPSSDVRATSILVHT